MEPFYLKGQAGALFAVYYPPTGQIASGDLLVVPPFAEELNRSRHMMAAAARALAASGKGALILDLYGTGDSAGRFDEATWDGWRADLDTAAAWITSQGRTLDGILALRSGALLALDWMKTSEIAPPTLALWGPVTGGAQFINQFLRLRVAESMARSDGTKETTKDLKALLDAGEVVEVGGYGLTREMAGALEAAKAADMPPPSGTAVHWFDLGADADAGLAPGAARVVDGWASAGVTVSPHIVEGPAFWSLQEPEHVPALIDATVAAFGGGAS